LYISFCESRSEMDISADLGSSSSYSIGIQFRKKWEPNIFKGDIALKAVVEKVSLRVALMQRLVGPKCPEKSN